MPWVCSFRELDEDTPAYQQGSRYTAGVKADFSGCRGYSGGPYETLEAAIEGVRKNLQSSYEWYEKAGRDAPEPSLDNIELRDKTGEVSKGELLGMGLSKFMEAG